jgi:DNA-binding cell septation regulator SpoVG
MLKQCKLLERQEKMEVVVKTNPYANQESGKMGVANVTFGDVFKARSMNIIKGRDNELFVSMPSYPTRKVDENERPIFQDYCHPVTKEFREQLYGAILESFKTGQDVKFDTGSGRDTPEVEITAVPIEGDSATKALARICLDGGFVVNNISIKENKDGELFVSMPSIKTTLTDEHGNPEYRDVCYPITKEFREQLNENIISTYHQAKDIAMDAADDRAEKKPQRNTEKTSVRGKIKTGQEKVANTPETKPPDKAKKEPER